MDRPDKLLRTADSDNAVAHTYAVMAQAYAIMGMRTEAGVLLDKACQLTGISPKEDN